MGMGTLLPTKLSLVTMRSIMLTSPNMVKDKIGMAYMETMDIKIILKFIRERQQLLNKRCKQEISQ
jgi:hypothetical protein